MTVAIIRLLAAPLWLASAAIVLLLAPVLALAGRAATKLSGRPEPLAMVRLLLVYVTGELAFVAGAARIRRRALTPEQFRERHYELLRGFLDDLVATAMSSLRLRLELTVDEAVAARLRNGERPVLVFSRHAGAGDSILLVHLLLGRFDRRPNVVLKELLAADPVVGLVSRRLPTAPIDSGGDDASGAILDLARELGQRSALLLFPEGGNFTAERRERAIGWLRRHGYHSRSIRAEQLEHMVSPRPGGVLAALEGAPNADVIFTAHTGLGRAAKGLSILRQLPRDTTLRVRFWHVGAADRPTGDEEQVDWLDAWWARLDDWVEAQGTE